MTPERRAELLLALWSAPGTPPETFRHVLTEAIRAAETDALAGAFRAVPPNFKPPPEVWPTQPLMETMGVTFVHKDAMLMMSARFNEMQAALERIRREDREEYTHALGPYAKIADSVLTETQDLVKPAPKPTPLQAIMDERKRQIEVEKFTSERDDRCIGGDLCTAALCYLIQAQLGDKMPSFIEPKDMKPVPLGWPWSAEWWKPTSTRRCLEKAGALAMAERDRLLRKNSASYTHHCSMVVNMATSMLHQLETSAQAQV